MKDDQSENRSTSNMREITNNVIGGFLYDQASGNAASTAATLFLLYLVYTELCHVEALLSELKTGQFSAQPSDPP